SGVRFAGNDRVTRGEVPKWSQRARLESGLGPNQPHVGSNPTLSAIFPSTGCSSAASASMPPAKPDVRVVSDLDELERAGAGEIARPLRRARRRRPFARALAGGGTPAGMYARLTREPYRALMPWPSLHLFFGDERHVPPESPDSNYRMVQESLVSKSPLPAQNVHRIAADNPDAEAAARDYETVLRSF